MDINILNHAKVMYIFFNNVASILWVSFVLVSMIISVIFFFNFLEIEEINKKFCYLSSKKLQILISQSKYKIKITLIFAFIYIINVITSSGFTSYYRASLIAYGISPQQIKQMVEANHNGR